MMDLTSSGQDLDGDQVPDVAFEGFSGGAHCCWTLWLVSLGDQSGLIQTIENQRPFSFAKGSGGRIDIKTWDGAFDYFEGPHAFSPFPSVYLRLSGSEMLDEGPDHWADYEKEIARFRKELKAVEIKQFNTLRTGDKIIGFEPQETKTIIFQIVLAYLYGGRASEARKALDEMWPAFDRERIWDLILKTPEEGILKDAVRAQPK